MKKLNRILIWILAFATFFSFYKVSQAQEDPISQAKKGIIEIYAGIQDKKGNFHAIKHGSGVVIGSSDNSSYLLTNYKFLHISEKGIKKFCKKNKIETEEYGSTNTVLVKAVVKGDVLVDATTVAESKEKNFTILEINNSMSEKIPVPIGDNSELVIGSKIYALGFSADAGEQDAKNRNTEYTYEDVVIYEGSIEDTAANKGGIYYLQHSALVNSGNRGGPILDEDGYIVGINDSSVSEDNIYYSIPINEVAAILDNYQLSYESKKKNLSLDALAAKIKECEELASSKEYKPKSKVKLQTAIEEAKSLQQQGNENMEAVAVVMKDLEEGKEALVLKMKTMRKVAIVFGLVDVLLLLWVLKLLLNQRKLKSMIASEGSLPQEKPAVKTERKKEKPPVEKVPEKPVVKEETVTLEAGFDPAADGEGTVLLDTGASGPRRPAAVLTLIRTGEKIPVTKPSFTLGVKENITDYTIKGNPAVSRLHATIGWDGEHYYISDRGSANGTYVNGDTVGKNQRHILKDGDSILLANEECRIEIGR